MYSRAHRLALAFAVLCAPLSGCGAATPRPTAPVVIATPPAGQPPGTAAAAAQPAPPTGSLRGVVVSATTRAPLARARVVATSSTLPDPRVTVSAPDGTFAFTSLPSGTYAVAVTRTGYVAAQFGERPSAPPTPIAVNAGESVSGVEVALQPAGVVAGQILDEDDAPFAGAMVDALVSRTIEGRPTLVSIASALTNDRGEFRLAGLPAGQVYVSASDPAFARVGDETGPLQYAPTYYPGVAFVEQATRVAVVPGAEPQPIVIKLHIIRPSRVAGIIRTPDARQLISGAVIMRPLAEEALAVVPTQDVMILPDGTFAFRNVPPGEYQIRARGEVDDETPSLFATFRVRVEGHDIGNVEMMLVPGARLEGQVLVEATKTPKSPQVLAGVRVRAPFVDGSAFGDALTGVVGADGSYAIRGVMTGSHMVTLEGLSWPWVLKSVTWRGQDITDTGIVAESRETYSDVRLTITDAASEIAGLVRDSTGAAVADATVLVIPASPQFWTRTSRRFRLLHSDASGRYAVRGLPPGEYRAVASVEIDDSEAYRREMLQELSTIGLPISVTGVEASTVDLTITPAPRVTRLSSR